MRVSSQIHCGPMNTFQRTARFAEWLGALADQKGKARIVARIEAAKLGNFGDCEPVGDGVSEMRIDVGPGYRAYYMREGTIVYLLLCGGDKSTQKADIALARKMAKQVKEAAKLAPEESSGRSGAPSKAKSASNTKSRPKVKKG